MFNFTLFIKRMTLFVFATILVSSFATSDEGMWTFDNPPLKQLKEKYGFEPTKEWLDHIRLSSVRFNDGGSGSFISPNGLVLTNHHVALGQLSKVSSKEKDYVKNGFYAATSAEEIKCPDLELNVLISMEDVTNRVKGVVKSSMSDKEALEARKAEIAKIEKENMNEEKKIRADIVTLYQGGEYWVYRYQKYTDIRLVMAPEQQAAFFGGDPDNFTFPRYDLDMAYFRVYENDKPIRSEHYLTWNKNGAGEDELVFVSGHPGSTNRLHTMAQMMFNRDYAYPFRLKTLQYRIDALKKFSAVNEENARRAKNQIFSLENSLKASKGEYQGLMDKNIVAKKQKEEDDFRGLVSKNSEWKKKYGNAWKNIENVQKKLAGRYKEIFYHSLAGSRFFSLGLNIVRYVTETKKEDGKRLDGYHDAQLQSLKFQLLSPAPIYPDLEEFIIAARTKEIIEALGKNDAFIKMVLNGKTPEEAANQLVSTKLADVEFRKNLIEGGEEAIAKSDDPMIVFARTFDPMGREHRKWQEDNIDAVLTTNGEKIGQARFAVYGKEKNPDATFTLRLSYGTVKGYSMNGTKAPFKTTIAGMYARSADFDNKGDFELPARFDERKSKVNQMTPINFVSTCDIIGGNSGSPVVNKKGELVGLIFDGNIESLVGRFVYDETANRAVAVHSAGMLECLRSVYDANSLADEIEGK
ncbi:MAG: S46 family peptidase [Ignavibacteria bacterium]|nr:S46 family peptidase [Ignavibacteria bacterium]